MPSKNKVETWNFDNSYASLPDYLFYPETPLKPENPELILFNTELANDLGLQGLTENKEEAASYLSGDVLPAHAKPIAQAYAGHQFGHFTMLGDGRAILLGEQITPTNDRVDIQLKGAGVTRYSRQGDGLATISAMLREYLMSEAMHHLGIPTTRSLAVVKNGKPVYRERVEHGAVLTRIASSHIRTGTFEYVRGVASQEELEVFTNYVIKRHFPEVLQHKNSALELLKVVLDKQIKLINQWMRVGFIHGVMNTDNMSICGETIDYGPCAFMNAFDPGTVFSSIDRAGRYAFGQQPGIALWNTSVFAQALLPLIDTSEEKARDKANEVLGTFEEAFNNEWYRTLFNKLGIVKPINTDYSLVDELMLLLNTFKPDYTNFFLELEMNASNDGSIFSNPDLLGWRTDWEKRITDGQTRSEALELMSANNPTIIPRNHLVEQALNDAVNGNMERFMSLLDNVKNPYNRKIKNTDYRLVPEGFDATYKTYCGT